MGNKITLGVVLAVVLLAAVVVGSTIGQANYVDLSYYSLIALGIGYFVYLYKFTWQIILLLIWSGARFNYGFALDSDHYAVALLLIYGILITLLRRNPLPSPILFQRVHSRRLMIILAVFLGYGILSFTLNKVSPHPGGISSTKNMLKGYFDAFGPGLALFIALMIPYTFHVKSRVWPTILTILCVSSLLNTLHLVYLFRQGFGGGEMGALTDEPVGVLTIPIVNASLGAFTMRGVGPIAVFFSFALICYPGWFKSQTKRVQILTYMVTAMGLIGAIMSGGRAAVLQVIFYLVIVSVVNRRATLIFAAGAMVMLLIVFANVFSGTVNNKLPMFVARPLQYVMIEKGDAMDSIEHSSDYRKELYLAALDEWKSEPRILLLGRSVFVPPNLDEERGYLGDLGAFVSVNLKSGTCHALLPSVLIQYGLIGAIIYYFVYISLIRFFWKIHKNTKSEVYSDEVRSLSFLMTVVMGIGVIIATIGGAWFGAFQIVMIILVKSLAARDEQAWLKLNPQQESPARSLNRPGGNFIPGGRGFTPRNA